MGDVSARGPLRHPGAISSRATAIQSASATGCRRTEDDTGAGSGGSGPFIARQCSGAHSTAAGGARSGPAISAVDAFIRFAGARDRAGGSDRSSGTICRASAGAASGAGRLVNEQLDIFVQARATRARRGAASYVRRRRRGAAEPRLSRGGGQCRRTRERRYPLHSGRSWKSRQRRAGCTEPMAVAQSIGLACHSRAMAIRARPDSAIRRGDPIPTQSAVTS